MENNHSPLPKVDTIINTLSFPEAIKQVIAGKKITKLDWNSEDEYVMLVNGYLCIHHEGNDTFDQWVVREVDLTGTDYKII